MEKPEKPARAHIHTQGERGHCALRAVSGKCLLPNCAERNALLVRLINNLNLSLINNLVSSRKDAKLAVRWGACLVKFAWQTTNEIKQT